MEKSIAGVGTIKKTALSKEVGTGGVFGIFGILCGAFSMSGTFNPVGIAYMASFLGTGRQFYLVLITVVAGFALTGMKNFLSDYVIAILLLGLYGFFMESFRSKLTSSEKAIATFFIFVLSGVIKGIIEKDTVYITVSYCIEALIIVSLIYIFDNGRETIKTAVSERIILKENLLGIIAIGGFAVAGASSLYGGVLPIHIILVFYMILITGYVAGAESCVTAGVVTGFALILAGSIDLRMYAVICASAVIGGVLRQGGKIMVILGSVSSAIIAGYYFGMLELSWVLGIISSCLLFLISAKKAERTLTVVQSGVRENRRTSSIQNYISERIMDYYRGIDALHKSLMIKKDSKEKTEKETEELADRVACIACENCPKNNKCWNSMFYDTYQTLMDLFSVCGKRGEATTDDLNTVFKDYCIKQNEFVEAVNLTYSSNREKLIWEMKLRESRQLAGEQLGAVAQMMKSLAEEIENKAGLRENLEKILLSEVRRKDKAINKVVVDESENGEYEVTLYKTGCVKEDLLESITDTVSGILGRKMKSINHEQCTDINGRARIILCERNRLKVSAAAAMAIRDDESFSGDSYSFMELPKGGYMIALSDGMGSGKEAGEESRTVIELLEQFAESGFKRELSLKLINSALVMGIDAESFATIDMCYIDMYSGAAEFIKTGAAVTFVIRDGRAKAIRSSSLPIGMLKYFDMDRAGCKLRKNDIILMLTDGAAEVIDRDGMSDIILTELMKNSKMKDPKEIADFVLEKIKEKAGFKIKDDMTVVAARIWG